MRDERFRQPECLASRETRRDHDLADGLAALGGSTVLLFAGMPVAISFIAINLIGAFLFLGGDAGLHQVARNSVSAALNFSLTPFRFLS